MKTIAKFNLQHFARSKNALIQHFIGEVDTEADLPLAKWISNIEDDSDEESEEYAFYDGDGTPETDVISVKKGYTVEGMYDPEDAAHALIAGLEFETGDGRKVMYKQVRPDGSTFEGRATVTEPVIGGGEAQEYMPISFGIAWDKRPEMTNGSGGTP